jgi:hypothetical protein
MPCLQTQSSQQRNDIKMPPLRRFSPNLGFRPETLPSQSGSGKVPTHHNDASKEGTTPTGAVAAGTALRRARLSSVAAHRPHYPPDWGSRSCRPHRHRRSSSSSQPNPSGPPASSTAEKTLLNHHLHPDENSSSPPLAPPSRSQRRQATLADYLGQIGPLEPRSGPRGPRSGPAPPQPAPGQCCRGAVGTHPPPRAGRQLRQKLLWPHSTPPPPVPWTRAAVPSRADAPPRARRRCNTPGNNLSSAPPRRCWRASPTPRAALVTPLPRAREDRRGAPRPPAALCRPGEAATAAPAAAAAGGGRSTGAVLLGLVYLRSPSRERPGRKCGEKPSLDTAGGTVQREPCVARLAGHGLRHACPPEFESPHSQLLVYS